MSKPPLLALDLGLKRTGVALSESGILARPLTVLEANPPHFQGVIQEIVGLVRQYEIETLVIGLPQTEEGKDTSQSLTTERLISQLAEALSQEPHPPVMVTSNEFHTSLDADQLYPDIPRDAAAAAIILQDYLDNSASEINA